MGDEDRPDRQLFAGSLRWVLVLGGVNLVLATVGYRQYLDDAGWSDVAFYALNLMFLNYHAVDGVAPPVTLDVARFAAHLVFALAVILAALTLLRGRVDRWRAGRLRDHVVVLGDGDLAVGLARAYRHRDGTRTPTVLVAAVDDAVRDELRATGIRVVEHLAEPELAQVVDGARRVVVAGHADDATLAWATRLPRDVARAHLVVTDRDLARELRGDVPLLGPTTADVCCVPERIATHVLALEPPHHDGRVAPPPVVIGEGPLVTELVRRIAFGWSRPADPVTIVCAGPDTAWTEELRDACRGRAELRVHDGPWSTRTARRLVAQVAHDDRPPAEVRRRRDEDGVLVVVAGLTDAVTLTLAAAVVGSVPGARVVAVVEDDLALAGLADLRRATGATLRVVSEQRLIATPAVLEADEVRHLAEELHRDARRWPDDVVGALGRLDADATTFDELSGAAHDRLGRVAASVGEALVAAGLSRDVGGDVAGEAEVLGPTAVAAVADRLRVVLPAKDEIDPDPFEPTGRYRQLVLAASLPTIAARVGIVHAPSDPDGADVLRADEIEAMAAECHRQYQRSQREHAGRLSSSTLGEQDWDALSPFAKESNRQQVRDIPVKLASVRLRLTREPGEVDRSWLTDEVVERLARWEHARWVHLHRLAGYRAGATTDHDLRIHDCLVTWDELPEGTPDHPGPRELDRRAVLAIPDVLAAAGLWTLTTDDPAATSATSPPVREGAPDDTPATPTGEVPA